MSHQCDHLCNKIMDSGFLMCQKCGTIILYECEHCYCLLRYKGANHACPIEEDEGLGLDIECDNNVFKKIRKMPFITTN